MSMTHAESSYCNALELLGLEAYVGAIINTKQCASCYIDINKSVSRVAIIGLYTLSYRKSHVHRGPLKTRRYRETLQRGWCSVGMLIFLNLGEGVPYGGGHYWWRTGHQWVATSSLYKPVRYLLRFCRSFEVKFGFPQFGERGPL